MKRIRRWAIPAVVAVGVLVSGYAAADSPSLEACTKYAEADHAYDEAIREPLTVLSDVRREAKATLDSVKGEALAKLKAAKEKATGDYRANYNGAHRRMRDIVGEAGMEVFEAENKAQADRDAAWQAIYAEAEASGVQIDPYGETTIEPFKSAFQAAETRYRAAMDAARDNHANKVNKAKADLDSTIKATREAARAATQQAQADYEAVKQPAYDVYAAALREPEAAFEAAKKAAEAAQESAYIAIYDDDDGQQSAVPAVMVKLRANHRERCRFLHGL